MLLTLLVAWLIKAVSEIDRSRGAGKRMNSGQSGGPLEDRKGKL